MTNLRVSLLAAWTLWTLLASIGAASAQDAALVAYLKQFGADGKRS